MAQSHIQFAGAISLLLTVLLALPLESRAAVVVVAVESGGDLVFTTEPGGSLNLTGMTFDQSMASSARMDPVGGFFQVGVLQFADQYFPPAVSPVPFGSGHLAFSDSGTGDLFGIASDSLFVPAGYDSGDPLNGTATYVGETLASRGLVPGTYVWNLPSDTITLHIVPVPAAAWLFVSAVGWLGWKRRKAEPA